MTSKRLILFDGWSLVHHPDGLTAGHLLTLLTCQPEDVDVVLALPGEPPEWLAGRYNIVTHAIKAGMRQRFIWEQQRLPGLAKQVHADLIHLCNATPALFAGAPNLLSPVDFEEPHRPAGVTARLRQAFSAGGMSRLAGLVWPSDIPAPAGNMPVFRVNPAPPFSWHNAVFDVSEDIQRLGLPETYVLCHAPGRRGELATLLEAYQWVLGPAGENYPLLILGLDEVGRQQLADLLADSGLRQFVRALPPISTTLLPWLYRKCSVVFHPAPIAPWGNPLRNAFACGKPLVAGETPQVGALVGPAAYLAPLDRPRELGAALLTVIVEEELASQLGGEGLRRASAWQVEPFRQGLAEIYRKS